MELPDITSGIPLVLVRSVKIRPGGNLEVPLECTRQLTNQMDIRIDTGFHHKNPNIYIPPSCINNPTNQYNPKYMPLTIFNLSMVDHLYIGKDTVIAFAEEPILKTYNIELASEDKIKEHLAKPRNWVPQRHETLPEIPHDTAFICSPADVPGPRKVQLQDKTITTDIRQKFEELCEEYGEAFSKNNEDIGRTKLVKMDIDTGDSPPVSSRPYTLPLKHYEWVQREIESLERAGVIIKSMSKWASPIVVVLKKSAPREPPKRRLCVDFRKVNELQQEVITAGKTREGQISIHPLQDTNTETLKRKLQHNRLDKEYYSLDENELLMRKVIDGGHEFRAIYLPSILTFQVLRTAHDDLGHNGFPRTYAALKRVFYWKGMKEDIRKHCKACTTCQLHKLENVKLKRKIFRPSLQPMDFICMDLIGEFHCPPPPTSHGHRYALIAVCMLTGFTWCVPLKTKTVEDIAKAYIDHICSNFGGSIKILTDNRMEFKNKLFKEVVKKLGTEFSIHSPPYRPQSNGKIEGFHRFLKTCIGKHISYGLEWDELTPMATACYNFFPNCNARESAFFIMFGRDPINKLNMLLHSARRYFHDDNGLPNLEALKNIYQVVAQELLNSRE